MSRLKSLGKAILVVSLLLVLTAIISIVTHLLPVWTLGFVILGLIYVVYRFERT